MHVSVEPGWLSTKRVSVRVEYETFAKNLVNTAQHKPRSPSLLGARSPQHGPLSGPAPLPPLSRLSVRRPPHPRPRALHCPPVGVAPCGLSPRGTHARFATRRPQTPCGGGEEGGATLGCGGFTSLRKSSA